MLASIDPTKIVAYLTTKRQFRVFNLDTKQAVDSFSQVIPNSPPRQLVTSFDNSNKIAYTQNRVLVIVDLNKREEAGSPFQIQIKREAKLTALTMTSDGKALAVGDEAGKIFHITNLGSKENNFVI